MTRENALTVIKAMPEAFDLEQLIEKLVLAEKIEMNIKDVDEGKGVRQDEVIWLAEEWRGK